MPLRIVPDDTKIRFMSQARMFGFTSIAAIIASIVLFFTVGLNLGIDFKGGTLMELRSQSEVADIADIRAKVGSLGLGDVEVTSFGEPNEVLIRVEAQEGGREAQDKVVSDVRRVLGETEYEQRRTEFVGPRIAGELAIKGTIAVIVALIGVLFYIWFRFEWQFAVGAIASLVHDVILTIGFFSVTQIDFNLSSLAAILTIVGYSLNDTVVVYDRVREMLRKFKQMSIPDLVDLSINQMLSRTLLTSITTAIALIALFMFGGEIIRSFTAAMIWGVVIGTYSSIYIASPILIYFNLRPGAAAAPETAESSKA
jgi:preprotein translocase SecF subunit